MPWWRYKQLCRNSPATSAASTPNVSATDVVASASSWCYARTRNVLEESMDAQPRSLIL
jgi:hypothetical protein